MHKITANQVTFPGICRICDKSPREEQELVDTELEFYDNGDDVTGRIFVCDECVHTMADLLGYVHEKQFKWELAQFQQEIENLRAFQREVSQLMNKKENKIAIAS
jgi:hypothetical protein